MARRRYANAKALEERVDQFFSECDREGRRYGIFALLVFLGVTEQTFRAWEEGRDKNFSEVARIARYRVLSQAETGQDSRPATLCAMALRNIGHWGEAKGADDEAPEVTVIINGLEEER